MDKLQAAIEEALVPEAAGSELAPTKINLALHVTGRRPDGYHNLETLVAFADYSDVVTAAPSSDNRMRLSVKGPFAKKLAEASNASDNLAIKAASELMRAAGKRDLAPVTLRLTKRIPIGAGLGGGSADAAATLRLLNRTWKLNLGMAKLAEIGIRIGADVPMCLASSPLVARGAGERITPVTGLPALPVVLAHPGVMLDTGQVFAALEPADRSPLPPLPPRFGAILDVIFWLRRARNDLAEPAAKVAKAAAAPAKVIMSDPECLFARMSGSGSAAFGIFVSLAAAERAAERIREARPNWWVAAAMTGAS